MKILVTGANGYIGQGVVKALLDSGNEVIATDIRDTYIDKRANIMLADIFTMDNPFEHFGQPEVVIHLAWRNGFVHNDMSHIEDLPKHYVFLKSLLEAGLKHLCVMGSMHEIGFFEGSINENTPTNPLSLYGISKDALRRSVELIAKQKEVIFQWIRGYYIVGNSEQGCSIFSKITEAEKSGKEFFPFTTGQNQWDFIDYDCFCNQIKAIALQEKYTGIINACSGRPEKLADRVERFIKENHYNIKLNYGTFPDRPYDSKAVWGDDTIIQKIMDEE